MSSTEMPQTVNEPLVSVVTPVYNGALFLAECIESVLAQSFQNFEYIIVNNSSSDDSLAIAEHYAAKDSRIKLVTTDQLLPAVENFNFTLNHISNESVYCKTLHADDTMFPSCIEEMVALAETSSQLGIIGSYYLRGTRVDPAGIPYATSSLEGRQVGRDRLLAKSYLFGSPSSTLIRCDLIRGKEPFYDTSFVHFDVEICMRLLRECDFGFVPQVLTYTRLHEFSITSRTARPAGTDTLESLRIVWRYAEDYFSETEIAALKKNELNRYYRSLARNIIRLSNKKVREYHIQGTRELGLSFSYVKVFTSFIKEVIERPLKLLKLQKTKHNEAIWSP